VAQKKRTGAKPSSFRLMVVGVSRATWTITRALWRSDKAFLVPRWVVRATRLAPTRLVGVILLVAMIVWVIRSYNITPQSVAWDWLDLLIVPVVVALATLWFNREQRKRELQLQELRARDAALQAYLDNMSELLTDKDQPLHRASPNEPLSAVAQAQTLTVLNRLDSPHASNSPRTVRAGAGVQPVNHKGQVLVFLYKAGLINIEGGPRINLSWANLNGLLLVQPDMPQACLRQTILNEAYLGANLAGGDLSEATLDNAIVARADLSEVTLNKAKLHQALVIEANLSKANLSEANLSNAAFFDSNLSEADLSGANLSGTYISEDQLDQTKSLEGATMPNGQKYEDWLKGKDHEEGG
jgi:uncharacterized protein YjbI with pentapeptide repeats